MLHIRPFAYTDQDYAAVVAVRNAIWPDHPETVVSAKHRDAARDPNYFYQHVVLEDDGKLVAGAYSHETSWSYRPGKYYLHIYVDPTCERRGIGTALYNYLDQVLAQRQPRPTLLSSSLREDKTQAIHFLQQRGFAQVMRSPTSCLDLNHFDATRYTGVIDKVLASGLQIYSVDELRQCDEQWQRKIYELDWECTQDEPLPDAPTKLSFEEYVKFIFENPYNLPAASFVALDHGHYVGMTGCNQNAGDAKKISIGFTGVLRSHRRRGIALALKLKTIDYAQGQNFQAVETSNEEHNPMYRMNLDLGFQPEPAWLDFQKII